MGLKWSISGSLSSRLVRKENLTKILQASENKFIHSTTQYLWVQKGTSSRYITYVNSCALLHIRTSLVQSGLQTSRVLTVIDCLDFKAEKSQLPKQRGSGPGRIRQRIFRPWASRTHKKNSAPRQKDSNQGII